jgi:hypothetical protein
VHVGSYFDVSATHAPQGICGLRMTTMTEHKQMEKSILAVMAGNADVRVVRAVRGMMDYLYLSQLHAQTASGSVAGAMPAALKMFHDNKAAFLENGARFPANWRIPKLEKMTHYAASILAHGTTDGYSTEHMERLHIVFCHDAFAAGNGKDYYEQMTVWMRRKEALARRASYLHWLYNPPPSPRDPDDDEDTLNAALEPQSAGVGASGASNGSSAASVGNAGRTSGGAARRKGVVEEEEEQTPGVYLAKKSPYPNTTVATIVDAHGAGQFLEALQDFVRAELPECTVRPSDVDRFDVYSQVRVRPPANPYMPNVATRERIRATRPMPAMNRRAAKAGVFDPALVERPNARSHSNRIERERKSIARSHGRWLIHDWAGYQAARVRVIFKLGFQFGFYPHALAYVEWYTPFSTPDEASGLYTVKPSTRMRRPHASVVRVDSLLRPCNLVAKVTGQRMDTAWKSDNVLDKAQAFFLNTYISLDFWSYFCLPPMSRVSGDVVEGEGDFLRAMAARKLTDCEQVETLGQMAWAYDGQSRVAVGR